MSGILGKKIGMSQIINEDGSVSPVTYLSIETNTITQIKTEDKDGYNAVVLGLTPLKKSTKTKKFRIKREFKVEDISDYKVGDEVNIDVLKEVKKVTITGVSKGKGFQGVMKRYNFAGGPKTHGSTFHRRPGSVGACAHPGEVEKGKKLPGHMGTDKITLKNRPVLSVDSDRKVVAIKGALPGANNGLLILKY